MGINLVDLKRIKMLISTPEAKEEKDDKRTFRIDVELPEKNNNERTQQKCGAEKKKSNKRKREDSDDKASSKLSKEAAMPFHEILEILNPQPSKQMKMAVPTIRLHEIFFNRQHLAFPLKGV